MATHPKRAVEGPRRGRPSLYSPERVEELRGSTALGWTLEGIADEFGVDRRTVLNWRNKFPELSHALKVGRTERARRVAAERRAAGLQLLADAAAQQAKDAKDQRERQAEEHAADAAAAQEAARALQVVFQDLPALAPLLGELPASIAPSTSPDMPAEPDSAPAWPEEPQQDDASPVDWLDPLRNW